MYAHGRLSWQKKSRWKGQQTSGVITSSAAGLVLSAKNRRFSCWTAFSRNHSRKKSRLPQDPWNPTIHCIHIKTVFSQKIKKFNWISRSVIILCKDLMFLSLHLFSAWNMHSHLRQFTICYSKRKLGSQNSPVQRSKTISITYVQTPHEL